MARSPYDQGGVDVYYSRPRNPRTQDIEVGSPEIILTDPAEIAEYHRGYDDEPFGLKDWGFLSERRPRQILKRK